jgi:hypothetical protein
MAKIYIRDNSYNVIDYTNLTITDTSDVTIDLSNVIIYTVNNSFTINITTPTTPTTKSYLLNTPYNITQKDNYTNVIVKNKIFFITLPFRIYDVVIITSIETVNIYNEFKKKVSFLPKQILVGHRIISKTLPPEQQQEPNVFIYNRKYYDLNVNQTFKYKYNELGGYPMIAEDEPSSNLTPPATNKDNENDDYVIKTLLEDPELSALFTLANFNTEWNKATLIKTIAEILANGTDETNPLTQVTVRPNTLNAKAGPTVSPDIKFLQNRDNTLIIGDYKFVNNTDTSGKINMTLDNNQTLVANSKINLTYNIDKNETVKKVNDDGYEITMNSGNPRCRIKKICNEKHYYRPDCSPVFNGDSCNCKCSSTIVFNYTGQPHTHCDVIEKKENDILDYISNIQTIQFGVKVPTSYTPSPYNNSPRTYDPDIDYLCELIADYYILLLKKSNGVKQQINNTIVQTNHQSYEDANELYKEEYMKIINISVGILSTGFIIYSILK